MGESVATPLQYFNFVIEPLNKSTIPSVTKIIWALITISADPAFHQAHCAELREANDGRFLTPAEF